MKWITATQLEQWGASIAARTAFPALIGDLIRASSPSIKAFRFPSKDKGQVRGFDGALTATGLGPYVPDGDSIWEFGTSNDATAKANEDYATRTDQVLAATRAQTTFVFASTRTWNNPNQKIQDCPRSRKAICGPIR